MSSTENEKLEEAHKDTYYNQLGLDVKKLIKKKISTIVNKQAASLPTIPDVEEATTKPAAPEGAAASPMEPVPIETPGVEEDPLAKEDSDKLMEKLNKLESALSELKTDEKLRSFKEEIMEEVSSITKKVQTELDELKSRQVPEVGSVDSGGVYKERIYDVAIRILDRVLIQFFEDIPDYSLIAVHVSRTFDDGTVSDAIVSVNVAIPNSGYRYDFKVDVPILNGIIQYPQYIQRGQKIIPLTKEKIIDELNSMAFRKIDVENPYSKSNIFNNIGDNIHKRPDNQKFYKVEKNEVKPVGLPPMSRWPAQKMKEEVGR
jgi:hypothetical protein